MNRPAMNPSPRAPLRMPGQLPHVSSSPMQPFAGERPYPIQPTPTFSFTDELDAELRRTQRGHKRSGGGGLLLVLMLLAGGAGYVAVKYRVWQDPGPLVQRAKELAQSLLTLAPSASPEPPRLAPPAPSQPRLAPEVVPITREPEPTTAAAPKHEAATRPRPTPSHHRRVESDVPRKTSESRPAPSSDPTEEELLAPPANRR